MARDGNNLRLHVQSAVPGSYIRVNPDVTPPTIEMETTRNVWTPLNFIPSVDLDATVTGAPGTSTDWRPPTLNAVIKYSKNIFLVLTVNWNDASLPCTPVSPSQVIVSSRVASPSLSATLSRTEASVKVGETIHYSVGIQNTGDVPLTGVTAAVADLGTFTYSATVTSAQTAKANVARGAARTFYVRVGNDGDATESLTVPGVDSGAAGYKVTYFDAGGADITAAVKAGTYVVPSVAPGATTTLRVKVKATTTSVRGSGHNADVRVTSTGDPSATDVVRAKVKRT